MPNGLGGIRTTLVWVFVAAVGAPAPAQETDDRDWLEITSIESSLVKNGKFEIRVKGKTQDIPAASKVTFRLTMRSRDVKTWDVVLRPGDFDETLEWEDASVTVDPMIFWTHLDPEEQKKNVRKALEKDSENWKPNLAPWAIQHTKQAFRLADDATIARMTQEIAAFVHGQLDALRAIEKASRDAVPEAEIPEGRFGKGEFDPRKWRKFQDRDVIEPLREVQTAIEDAAESSRYDAHRAQIFSLQEISKSIAEAVLRRSVEVYEYHELPSVKMDTDPEEHELLTDHRGRKLTNDAKLLTYLKGHVQRINVAFPKPKAPKPGEDQPKSGDPSRKPSKPKSSDSKKERKQP